MLINEENIVLEARVQVSLEAKLANDGVVVAVNVSVHTIHALEDLSDHTWERLRERNTFK